MTIHKIRRRLLKNLAKRHLPNYSIYDNEIRSSNMIGISILAGIIHDKGFFIEIYGIPEIRNGNPEFVYVTRSR